MRTRRCSEREPADSLRDKFNVIGGWLPSLTFSFGLPVQPGGLTMDRDYWTRSIRKWFQPYNPDSNENVGKQYYGGVKKGKTGEDEGLRSIRVRVAARRTRHFD